MNRSDIVSGILLAALGGYAAVKSYSFGLGALSQPGAGFFPFWASILMLGCAGAIVAHAVLRMRAAGAPVPRAEGGPAPQAARANWKKVVQCVAILVAYAILLPWVGFAISTFLVMLVLSRMDPETTWRGAILIAGLGAAGFWVIFMRLLEVRFPAPAFGF